MNKENLKDELKPFYEKGDCCSWIVELRKDKYQLQQENKQLKEKIDILLEDNNQLEEIRIKAIEYIKERFEINEYGEYYFTHTFDNSNMKELLEILGDKE